MSRFNPYGGYDQDPGRRRNGPPPGRQPQHQQQHHHQQQPPPQFHHQQQQQQPHIQQGYNAGHGGYNGGPPPMQNGGPPMQNVGNHRNDGGRLMQASQPFRGEPQRFNEGPPPQQYQGSIGPDRQSHAPYRNLSGGQNPPSAGPPLSARDPPPYNRGPYDQRPEPDMRQSRPDHGPMHANDRMSGPPPQAQGYNSAYGQDRGNFGGPPPPNNFRDQGPPVHNQNMPAHPSEGPRPDFPTETDKIEKRIARERPCRTLFVRNVKYDTDGGLLRSQFAAAGEMKSFFDLISTRGLIFITYFDLRVAIEARDKMQGFVVAGRPIDVHYSLPRDEDKPNRRVDKDKHQGTVRIVLQDTRNSIREADLDQMFRGFGAIKGIYHTGGDPARERLLEFFDMRAMSDAFDRMNGVPYPGGGTLEVLLDWDVKDIPLSTPATPAKQDFGPRGPPPNQGSGRPMQQQGRDMGPGRPGDGPRGFQEQNRGPPRQRSPPRAGPSDAYRRSELPARPQNVTSGPSIMDSLRKPPENMAGQIQPPPDMQRPPQPSYQPYQAPQPSPAPHRFNDQGDASSPSASIGNLLASLGSLPSADRTPIPQLQQQSSAPSYQAPDFPAPAPTDAGYSQPPYNNGSNGYAQNTGGPPRSTSYGSDLGDFRNRDTRAPSHTPTSSLGGGLPSNELLSLLDQQQQRQQQPIETRPPPAAAYTPRPPQPVVQQANYGASAPSYQPSPQNVAHLPQRPQQQAPSYMPASNPPPQANNQNQVNDLLAMLQSQQR